MQKTYHSESEQETQRIAAEVAKTLSGGEVLAFTGGLGMGKTAFVRGLAEALGFQGEVSSPTFALINEYLGGRLPIYHFDMYRVSGWEDLYSTGYFEYAESGGVVAVEWSENIAAALPQSTIYIDISRLDDNKRIITVSQEEKD